MQKLILMFLFLPFFDYVWAENFEKIIPKKAQIIILINEDIEFTQPNEQNFSAKNILNEDYVRVVKNRIRENVDHEVRRYKKGVSYSISVNYKF